MNATRAANQFQKPGAEQFPVSGCVSTVKRSKRCTKEHTDKDLIMKNIVENQGIKNDKPLALSCEQLKQQLEAREREVMALNVKNEKLIEAMRAIYTDGFLLTTTTGSGDNIYLWDYICDPKEQIEQWIAESKATDAALAAVEARGVDKFAEQQEKLAADYRKLSPGCYGEVSSQENALMARAFAVELREGRV